MRKFWLNGGKRLSAVVLATLALIWQFWALSATLYPKQVLAAADTTGLGQVLTAVEPTRTEKAEADLASQDEKMPEPEASAAVEAADPGQDIVYEKTESEDEDGEPVIHTQSGDAEPAETLTETEVQAVDPTAQEALLAVEDGQAAAEPEPETDTEGFLVYETREDAAPTESTESEGLFVMVYSLDQLGNRIAGETFTVSYGDTILTATAGDSGTARLGPLVPGDYDITFSGGTARFTLLSNGSVESEDALAAADGEYLALSIYPWCCLTVSCRISDQAEPDSTLTITTPDETLTRIVSYGSDLTPEADGTYLVTYALDTLPEGDVTVTKTSADGQDVTVRLTLLSEENTEVVFD